MRSLMILLLAHYCAGDNIENNEMSAACSAYGEVRGVYRVLVGNLRERDHWINQAYEGR
jgi:hypothetical protein